VNEFYYKEEIKLLETENLNLQEKIKNFSDMIDKLLDKATEHEKEKAVLNQKIERLTKMLDETLNYILGDSDEKRIRNQN